MHETVLIVRCALCAVPACRAVLPGAWLILAGVRWWVVAGGMLFAMRINGRSVAAICWALLCIEEVGNTIEDPFNMPFLFKGPPYRDELKVLCWCALHVYSTLKVLCFCLLHVFAVCSCSRSSRSLTPPPRSLLGHERTRERASG